MTAKERVEQELKEVKEKRDKLARFLRNEIYTRMTEEEQCLLENQFCIMCNYVRILERRLEIWREL